MSAKRHISADTKEQIRRMRESGMTYSAIARTLKVCLNTAIDYGKPKPERAEAVVDDIESFRPPAVYRGWTGWAFASCAELRDMRESL